MKRNLWLSLAVSALAALMLIGCSSGDLAALLGGKGSRGGPTKTLAVGDRFNSRVLLFNVPVSNGQSATVVLGQPDFTSNASGTSATTMDGPNTAKADVNGNIWVADTNNNRVLEFKPPFSSGMAASVVLGQPDMTSNGSGVTATTMEFPVGVVSDSAGNIWMTDQDNSRVLEFKPPFTNGMAASVVIGEPDFVSKTCAVTATGLCFPDRGIVFDASGNLWVGDTSKCRILEYKPPFTNGMAATLAIGAPDTSTTGCGVPVDANHVHGAYGMTFDSAGDLWMTDGDNSRVLEFKPPFASGMAASAVLGQADFTSALTTGPTQALMAGPVDVAFDSSGNLYVADETSARITIYNPPFTNGMNATTVLGQPDFTTSTGYPPSATTFSASGVTTMK